MTYIEKQVGGITLKDGDTQVYLEGQHFALPSPEKQGHTFIGWRNALGNFVNSNFIPLENGIVLEAVYEPKTQSDGRSQYAPAVVQPGTDYRFVVFGSQPFWFRLNVQSGERIRITFEYSKMGCQDNHVPVLFGDLHGDEYYAFTSGVAFRYEECAMRIECDTLCGVTFMVNIRVDVV